MTTKVTRPLEDELKLIRGILTKLQFDTSRNSIKLEVVQDDLEVMSTNFKDMDQKLFKWKSDIHTLIDKGFSKKAKAHDEEIGILNVRTLETRKKVEKLEKTVYKSS